MPYTPKYDWLTPSDIKSDYCFGLSLADQDGNVMPDSVVDRYIGATVMRFERDLHIDIGTKVIKCNAEKRGLDNYDIDEDAYDFWADEYRQWGYIQLRRRPVVSVENVELYYPTGQRILKYDDSWIMLNRKAGHMRIVPSAGTTTTVLLGTSSYLPLMNGSMLQSNVPGLFRIDYTSGMTTVPEDMADAIAKAASCSVLAIAGDAKVDGIASQSISQDGLSESRSTTASQSSTLYGARIKQYTEEVEAYIKSAKSYYRGIRFIAL